MATPPTGSSAQVQDTTPGNVANVIEVDDVPDDSDSAYVASSFGSDTTSLKSTALRYKWENGRRYHAPGDSVYWSANDERQQEAEDIAHELYRLLLRGKLVVAPIPSDPQRVLDIGCGTGMWAIDFADLYPSAEVIGADISPIQPLYVPPNCKFVIDDMNKDWAYPENYFDFIHVRAMIGCVPDWTAFHRKVLRHLKPGGWIEQVELSSNVQSDDGTLSPDTAEARWKTIFDGIGEKIGNSFATCEIARECVEAAGGFTNITERRTKVPIGMWPKDPELKNWGAWLRLYLLDGLEGFALRGLTVMLDWSVEETQLYLVQLRKELNDPSIHSYIELSVVTAQKPPVEV